MLTQEICEEVTICVVPSSNKDNRESGMAKLGEMLAQDYSRKNKVFYLERTKSISKLAAGGDRSKEVHLRSISTVEHMDISGEIVLLMDDVTTTGNSLYACREILLQHGAEKVEMFALGKAI